MYSIFTFLEELDGELTKRVDSKASNICVCHAANLVESGKTMLRAIHHAAAIRMHGGDDKVKRLTRLKCSPMTAQMCVHS